MLSRPTLFITAIRREILAVLAESDAPSVRAATAQVATGWSARRRRHGHSPSSARATAALVYQVGADLASDLAGEGARPPLESRSAGDVRKPRHARKRP